MGPAPARLLVVALLLAGSGCASAPSPTGPRALGAGDAVDPDATTLRVLVITDEYLPVESASVRIVGLGVNSTTDEFGNAYFSLPDPGRYSVHVNHKRFYPNVTKLTVGNETELVVRVPLRDAPPDGHSRVFYFFEGLCYGTIYVQGVHADGRCGENPYVAHTQPRWFLDRGLTYGFLTLDWAPSFGFGAATMRLSARFPDAGVFADGRDALIVEGRPSLDLEIAAPLITEPMKENGVRLDVRVGVSEAGLVATAINQDFLLIGQFDFFVPAPDVDPEM